MWERLIATITAAGERESGKGKSPPPVGVARVGFAHFHYSYPQSPGLLRSRDVRPSCVLLLAARSRWCYCHCHNQGGGGGRLAQAGSGWLRLTGWQDEDDFASGLIFRFSVLSVLRATCRSASIVFGNNNNDDILLWQPLL